MTVRQKQKSKKLLDVVAVSLGIFYFIFAGIVLFPDTFNLDFGLDDSFSKEEDPVLSLDFDAIVDQTLQSITDPQYFPLVKDVSITKDENTIYFYAVVSDLMNPSDALSYADTMVRQLNMFANFSNQEIAMSDTDYYGGLYDYYNIMIGVSPLSKVNDSDKWFVHDYVGARLHTKQPIELEDAFLNDTNSQDNLPAIIYVLPDNQTESVSQELAEPSSIPVPS